MPLRPDVERALASIVAGVAAHDLENESLDFKTEKPSLKDALADLADACVCFANGSGGTVVVGVRDRPGGPDALVGTNLDAEQVRARVYELARPALMTVVETHHWNGVRLLAITVPEGLQVHSDQRGVASRRLGSSCLPMAARDVARLDEERRGLDWSAAASGMRADSVDETVITVMRRLLGDAPGAPTPAEGNPDRLLGWLGLAYDSELSRAGALLAANDVHGRDRLVYSYARTTGGEPVTVRRWQGPLVTAFLELLEMVGVRMDSQPVNVSGGVQIRVEDFPLAAVREAVANAMVHGDHRLAEAIWVEHSPQAFRVRSPGPLVAGVTTTNILTRGSRARFASMARAFRQLGLAEEIGQGVNRMFRQVVSTGRDAPRIESTEHDVTVTFPGQRPNVRMARLIHDLPVEEREDTDALLVLNLLGNKRTVSATELEDVLQKQLGQVEEVLRRMSEPPVDLLEPTAGTSSRRHPNYRLRAHVIASLGPTLGYRRRDTRELDRKVVEHVTEYGYINNATLQRAFDVDVYGARDMLRDLVGRELLVRTSEQRRGKAVRYGPGPRFPGRKGGR